MKTAMQELFQFMEQSQYFIGNDLFYKYNELLEKEKQQIIDSYDYGLYGNETGTQYFNEKFNNQKQL